VHAHGFARAVCETCGDELLSPFSCKLRGICPSCNMRRMSNTAAHLVDHIIAPDVTLRQWVLTVPLELRLLLAARPDALSAVGRIFIQEIQRWQRQLALALGLERAEGAAVSFCQRFGSSLNRLGHSLPESLRHRPARVLELWRTDALRRRDRGRRPSAQRAPPSKPARGATAVDSLSLAPGAIPGPASCRA
jgi:hypothetical protein